MNRNFAPVFIVLILFLLVTACGGDDDEKQEPTSVPTKEATEVPTEAPPPPTPEPQGQTPQELGQEIGVLYVEALEKVTELVADHPPVEEVRPQVEALKETYVQQLFELGKQREALSEQDKTAVDSAILMEVSGLSQQDWYDTYNEAVQHYFDEDYEFQQVLLSFNIIGQYANFDLLKDQEPEEAVRLGILDPSEVAEAEPTATTPPEPTAPPETAADLGEAQRNETGGFVYRPIAGYDVFDEPGSVFMSAPDMTSDAGPVILIVGGLADKVLPADQVLEEFAREMGDVEMTDQGEYSLSGATGQMADVSGTANDGQPLAGRIVVLWVDEGQAFMMAGAAPPERWEGEVEPLFQAVLNSISFFEPAAEPMPAAELDWEPGWYAYTNGNDVKGLALHQGSLYAAGTGGLSRYVP